MPESSREKFVRLTEARVNTLIKTIRLLGNLSNKSNYSYRKKDVDKIFHSIEKELKVSKGRFRSGGKTEDSVFKLD